jgi:hypothetical protein
MTLNTKYKCRRVASQQKQNNIPSTPRLQKFASLPVGMVEFLAAKSKDHVN